MPEEEERKYKPPQIYEFPPLFTWQPNISTRQAQLRLWQDIIVDWSHATGNTRVTRSSDIFENPRIHRSLRGDAIVEILGEVVKNGLAEYVSPKEKDSINVYGMSPASVASLIKKWSDDYGYGDNVVTLFEITEGELPGLERLAGVDLLTIRRGVEVLVKRHEGAAMEEEGEIVGIKLSTA